jgi:hypothetical protein
MTASTPPSQPPSHPAAATTGPLDKLARRYRFDDHFLDMLVGDFTPADWKHRDGEGNNAQWLLGHLATTRRWARRILDPASAEAVPELPWEQHFGRGGRTSPQSDALDPVELKRAFVEAGGHLAELLEGLQPDDLSLEIEVQLPYGKTVDDVAHFLHFHEAYHFGQLGLLRRGAGKPGAV